MKYERFEDLPVWQAAIELARGVYLLTRERCFAQPGDLRDQLRRAALSVSNNVAEGFERGSTAELLAFLYIARGSAGEERSMLRFAAGLAEAGHLKREIADLVAIAEACSRQIRAWAGSLHDSEIQGQRHLTSASRRADQARRRASEFRAKVQADFRDAHLELFPGSGDEP